MSRGWVAGAFLAPVALAGCGHSSGHSAPGTVTVPAYGVYAKATVAQSGAPRAKACQVTARSFAGEAVRFVAHVRPHGAYPADLYYVIMREHLANFQAHRCDLELLGSALARGLTESQRRTLLAALPNPMAATVVEGLDRAGF